MDYSKLIVAFLSIAFGWILAQSTGIVKDWVTKKKIIKCLLEELEELHSELERTLLIYSRQLQIHALKGIDNGTAIPLSNHIFQNYYKDAVLELNKHQRISFQLIHSSIENLNLGILEQREITSSLQEKHMIEGAESITERDSELWGNKVICEFTNVATTLWHIKFHLNHPDLPDLTPFTKDHEEYLKYIENVSIQISEIIEASKTLELDQFKKVYDPESFAKQFF